MVGFKPSELYGAADNVVDFTKGLASDIVNTMKGLYRDYPRGFVPGDPDSGIGSALRGYWDSFFSQVPDPDLPLPPSRPYTGGQCPVEYNVFGTTSSANPTTWPCNASVPWTGRVFGVGIRLARSGGRVYLTNDAGADTPCIMEGSSVQGISEVPDCVPRPNGFPFALNGTTVITSVSRVDGLPDTCGNPPLAYPSDGLPPSSNPGEYSFPGNGGVPVRVPYSIDFDPTVIVPIVKVDLNGEVSIPVSFDAGGINVDLPDLNIGGGDSGGISPEALEALLDAASKIPDIQENIDDLVNGGNQTSDNLGEQEGEQEGYVPDISGLVIQVTGIPTGSGRKFGKPQIFDFGRAHFKRGDFYSEEIPLATVRQWCVAPPDSDGYAIYLKPGVTANVTVVKQVKENGG